MITIDLAIVIPTLNEEKFIGKLLDSISDQSISPKNIIVIDAYSNDKTIDVVKKRQSKLPQLKFFQIPKSTISRQRNFGVSKTRAKNILFLDADMYLKEKDCLEKYMAEIEAKKPDIAAAFNYPLSENFKDKIFFFTMNGLFKIIKPFWPMANGMNIYIKRSFFEKVGKFNEALRVGEDHELVQRATKLGGKFIYLDNVRLYTSTRRYAKEGRRNYTLKMIYSFFYVLIFGYKENPIEYEFGKHEVENK